MDAILLYFTVTYACKQKYANARQVAEGCRARSYFVDMIRLLPPLLLLVAPIPILADAWCPCLTAEELDPVRDAITSSDDVNGTELQNATYGLGCAAHDSSIGACSGLQTALPAHCDNVVPQPFDCPSGEPPAYASWASWAS